MSIQLPAIAPAIGKLLWCDMAAAERDVPTFVPGMQIQLPAMAPALAKMAHHTNPSQKGYGPSLSIPGTTILLTGMKLTLNGHKSCVKIRGGERDGVEI